MVPIIESKLTTKFNMKIHQGSAIKEWIEKKYDSVNRLCILIAEEGNDEDFIKNKASLYSLIRGITQKDFATQRNHQRWDDEIAPYTGVTLEEVIKEMGEKDEQRAKGIVISDNSREVLVLRAKNETLENQNETLLEKYNELFEKMLTKLSPN